MARSSSSGFGDPAVMIGLVSKSCAGKPIPSSYMVFVSKVGPMTFRHLDDEEGFDASILMPGDLDTTEYRRGVLRVEDEDSARTDGISFANTGHGGSF